MGRIILFEKDSYVNKQLAHIIQDRLLDVKIKIVFSCEECLTELQVFTPDILMLGANVTDCKSLDLIVQIRQMYPGIIIFLITDYDIDEYRKDAILKGANHIISKEVWTGAEILALINTTLTTKTNQDSTGTKGLPVQ
jgi:DNA-binding response OmpR family regulator